MNRPPIVAFRSAKKASYILSHLVSVNYFAERKTTMNRPPIVFRSAKGCLDKRSRRPAPTGHACMNALVEIGHGSRVGTACAFVKGVRGNLATNHFHL